MIGAAVFFLLMLAVAFVCSWGYEGDEAPAPYKFRGCEGRRWKKQFPEASKEEIRRFLSIFVTSFGFREKDRLKFSPYDRIGDVYGAAYGPHPFCDGLEMGEFFCRVEDTYGLDLANGNEMDTTLGALFKAATDGTRQGEEIGPQIAQIHTD